MVFEIQALSLDSEIIKGVYKTYLKFNSLFEKQTKQFVCYLVLILPKQSQQKQPLKFR